MFKRIFFFLLFFSTTITCTKVFDEDASFQQYKKIQTDSIFNQEDSHNFIDVEIDDSQDTIIYIIYV